MSRRHPQRRMPRRPASWFRRGLAVLLLLVFAILLSPGADAHDQEGHHHTHPPICSLFCLDQCTTATLPAVPEPPPPDPMPERDFSASPVPRALTRTVEPELAPPRS